METGIKYVYLAGPMTHGNKRENILKAYEAGNHLMEMGVYPFIPHFTCDFDTCYPRTYEDWMDYDFKWLERCDALIRLEGHSPGADREVEFAKSKGIPVFMSMEQFAITNHWVTTDKR